jgi:hypothetical protein
MYPEDTYLPLEEVMDEWEFCPVSHISDFKLYGIGFEEMYIHIRETFGGADPITFTAVNEFCRLIEEPDYQEEFFALRDTLEDFNKYSLATEYEVIKSLHMYNPKTGEMIIKYGF